MARGVIRGMVAGLSVAALGLAVVSAVAPPPPVAPGPAPATAVAAPAAEPVRSLSNAMPAAAPVVAPGPGTPLPPRLAMATALVAPAVDAAPHRPAPGAAPKVPFVLASLVVRPDSLAPRPAQRARAAEGPVTAPAPLAQGGMTVPRPATPVAILAEAVPQLPRAAAPPAVAAEPVPAARPVATAVVPPVPPVAAPVPEILSRSSADPALVLPGAAADVPPVTEKPPVRRPGGALLAQTGEAPVMKKPAPLQVAPGLKTSGAPATEGTLAPARPAEGGAAPAAGAQPPRVAFARPFENAAQKPLLSVVLFDTGAPDLDRTALAALPFPVTFVLDPARPESALAASIYRAGGQEVAMLATAIPQGATASDVEVTFAAHAAALPEAVAVVVPEADGFQDNRPVATLVVPVVAGQGRGLLSWDRGLNAADQVARREGAYAATIFRRLDGKGEDAARIRQYLDRAAFKAAQEGRVVVAGETRPETVQALLEWAVEGRASSVAMAPLTAAMQSQ